MLDLVKLQIQAGNGGNGKISFHREKYITKGGPDGGDGGNGGSVIIEGSKHISTLDAFMGKKKIVATDGQMGGKRQMIGKQADDLILPLPIGTVVWLLGENETSKLNRTYSHFHRPLEKYTVEAETGYIPPREPDPITSVDETQPHPAYLLNESIKDLDFRDIPKLKLFEVSADGEQYVLCQGGKGGRGNKRFASSSNQTPLEAEYGGWGEQKIVVFEHKLLADVGLVGYPNAGKSTLISVVTKAKPKIANYPFTTLEANLGILHVGELATSDQDRKEMVIADIPGLIEGASEGKGLGYTFLRHIEHCRVLVYVLSLDESVIFDSAQTETQKADQLWTQFQHLQTELKDYDQLLLDKPWLVVVNKVDLYPAELQTAIRQLFQTKQQPVHFLSALTGEGMVELKRELMERV